MIRKSWQQWYDDNMHVWNKLVINKRDFKPWFFGREKVGRFFDTAMMSKCYNISRVLEREQDYFIVIVGDEGSGKSKLSFSIAATIDPTFTLERVYFDAIPYIKGLRHSVPKQSHVIDEGGQLLFSRQSMSRMNINIARLFMVMRAKRTLTLVNIPDYGLLDTFVRRRADLLIRMLPGFRYQAYYGPALDKIRRDWGKVHNLAAISVPEQYFWHGSTYGEWPVGFDVEVYKTKKMAEIDKFMDRVIEDDSKRRAPYSVTISDYAKRQGISYHTAWDRANSGKLRTVNEGGRLVVPEVEINRIRGADTT